MILISALALVFFMRFGPDIPINRFLNYYIAEKPIIYLLAKDRHQYIFLLVATAMLLLGGEFVIMFGPEFILAYAADLALYLDIVVVTALANSVSGVRRAFCNWKANSIIVQSAAPSVSRRPKRSSRAQRKPTQAHLANDDEDGRDGTYELMTSSVALAA